MGRKKVGGGGYKLQSQKNLGANNSFAITSCMTWSKMLNLTEYQFIISKIHIIMPTYENLQAYNAHEIKYIQHSSWSIKNHNI